jgi:hypothetical protein
VNAGVFVLAAYGATSCGGQSSEDHAPTGGTGGSGAGVNDASGGSGGSGTSAGPIAVTDYPEAFSKAYCAIGPCCQHEGYSFNQASCESALKSLLEASVSSNLNEPGVEFDETAAGACVEFARKFVTACTDPTLLAGDNPCDALYYGTVPAGGTCTVDTACAPISGVAAVACNSGVCGPSDFLSDNEARGKAGDPCNSTCEETLTTGSCSGAATSSTPAQSATACYTNDGLYCTPQYVCAPQPKLGEACDDTSDDICAQDTYCSGSVCVAATATGPCQSSSMCLHTSYCDNDTGQCVPLKANGKACTSDLECSSENCDVNVCHEWSAATAMGCSGQLQ